jgi:hypothetical protein
MPLDEAIRMSHKRGGDHRNQYSLALLLEEHYLGMTINYTPPEGFDRMREFALAITLHMYLLPADDGGVVTYQGIRSSGGIDPKNQRPQKGRCTWANSGRSDGTESGRQRSGLRPAFLSRSAPPEARQRLTVSQPGQSRRLPRPRPPDR